MRIPLNVLCLIGCLAGTYAGSYAQGIFDYGKAACPPTCGPVVTPPPGQPIVPSVIPQPVPLPTTTRDVPVVITALNTATISGCFQNGPLCVYTLPVTIDVA